MGVLYDHHKVLQKMKNTGLEEEIFDYYLYLSSGDEAKDAKYTKALDNS